MPGTERLASTKVQADIVETTRPRRPLTRRLADTSGRELFQRLERTGKHESGELRGRETGRVASYLLPNAESVSRISATLTRPSPVASASHPGAAGCDSHAVGPSSSSRQTSAAHGRIRIIAVRAEAWERFPAPTQSSAPRAAQRAARAGAAGRGAWPAAESSRECVRPYVYRARVYLYALLH